MQYISYPILIIGILGMALNFKSIFKHKNYHIVTIWWFGPLIVNAAIAKVFTARYILFTLPPLIILLSAGIYYFLKYSQHFFHSSFLLGFTIFLFFAFNIFWIYHISVNPFSTTLPSTESGYLSDWTSGWGIRESANYFIEQSKKQNVIVGTEGYFGTLPDGLEIYTNQIKQLTVIGVGVDLVKVPENLIDARKHGDEVFLLINKSRNKIPPSQIDKLKLIRQFDKPQGDYLQLFQFN